MASDPKCKLCRRAGERLFLKGERCYSPKCAMVKNPTPPGQHGTRKKGRRNASAFGAELREKQKIRLLYGLSETQLGNYASAAKKRKTGVMADNLVESLEQRLDNAVFRAGFGISRSISHNLVTYGHMTLNGKPVSMPSLRIKKGDIIGIRVQSAPLGLFKDVDERFKKYVPPKWIEVDKTAKTATVIGVPTREDSQINQDLKLVVQYYSR